MIGRIVGSGSHRLRHARAREAAACCRISHCRDQRGEGFFMMT
jgi:hypothetical protein